MLQMSTPLLQAEKLIFRAKLSRIEDKYMHECFFMKNKKTLRYNI